MSMTQNEYKEAAEAMLKRAETQTTGDFGSTLTANRIQGLTEIARVYAMLAAIPDTTVQDRVPPFNTGKRRHAVDVDTDDECMAIGCHNPHGAGGIYCTDHNYTAQNPGDLAVAHRHYKAAAATGTVASPAGDKSTALNDLMNEMLAVQRRHDEALSANKDENGICMMYGCHRGRRDDSDYCDGHTY